MRRSVKWAIGLGVVAVAGWTAWWFVGAGLQEAGVEKWLKDQRKRGWQAEAEAVAVRGYPLDFNLHLSEVALADPEAGWTWQSPGIRADSAAFQPNSIRVSLPERHVISVPGETIALVSSTMSADLHVAARRSMALQQTGIEIADLVLEARSGWSASATQLAGRVALRPETGSPPNTYEVQLDAGEVVMPRDLIAALDPSGLISPRIDEVELSGFVALDRPLDRDVVEKGRVALRTVILRRAGFSWGTMRLDVRGKVDVDRDGYPVGEMEVFARDWRDMIRLARQSGWIGRDLAQTIEGGLEFVAALSGKSDALTVPLTFRGGRIRLGPVPIARAPRIAPPR